MQFILMVQGECISVRILLQESRFGNQMVILIVEKLEMKEKAGTNGNKLEQLNRDKVGALSDGNLRVFLFLNDSLS